MSHYVLSLILLILMFYKKKYAYKIQFWDWWGNEKGKNAIVSDGYIQQYLKLFGCLKTLVLNMMEKWERNKKHRSD